MENILFRKYLIFLSTLILTGCVSVQNGSFQEAKAHFSKRQFLVWMLSDIQPKTTLDRNVFEAAVADVKENIGSVDMGIMAGIFLNQEVMMILIGLLRQETRQMSQIGIRLQEIVMYVQDQYSTNISLKLNIMR